MKRAALAIVMTVFLAACSNEPTQAEKDLEKVNEDIGELQSEIQQVRSENEAVESDITNKERELEEVLSGDSDDSDEDEEESGTAPEDE